MPGKVRRCRRKTPCIWRRCCDSASRSTEGVAYIETHRESLRPISKRPSIEKRWLIGTLAPFCDSDSRPRQSGLWMALYLLPARAQFVNRAVQQFRSPPPVQAVVATAWLRRLVHSKDDFQEIDLANSSSEQRRLVKQRPKLGWWFIGSLLLVATLGLPTSSGDKAPRLDLANERAQAATENPSETNRLAQRRTAGCG